MHQHHLYIQTNKKENIHKTAQNDRKTKIDREKLGASKVYRMDEK